MNGIVLALAVVAIIGLICGILLSAASKVMSVPVDETFEKVRELLPGANCGACGYSGCDDYANAIAKGECQELNLCKPGGDSAAASIGALLGRDGGDVIEVVARVRCTGSCDKTETKYEWKGGVKSCKGTLLMYSGRNSCTYGCIGYGDCAAVCPQKAIVVKDGLAKVYPGLCFGCGMCAKECPVGIIDMIPQTAKVFVECSNKDKGKAAMSVCSSSCIGCSKCEKVCEAGAVIFENNLAKIDQDKCTGCGACAEACPRGCIVKFTA